MIKRTVDISTASYISTKYNQLIIQSKDDEKTSVPIEDLGVLILSHPGITITKAATTSCLDNNIVVLFCDNKHLPQSILMPLSGHTLHTKTLRAQIDISRPVQKKLWKSIVQEKIKSQCKIIKLSLQDEPPELISLIKRVRSGDPENIEGQAARIYWRKLMGNNFRRDPMLPGINTFLNYGYAIVRATVARALVGAGFHPSIGLHHHNQYNSLCLADDLMEPLRPIVDLLVYKNLREQKDPLTPEHKKILLEILYMPCNVGQQTVVPLVTATHHYAASLRKVINREEKALSFPKI